MKNKYIIITFCLLVGLTSCKKYLEIKPNGKAIPNTAEEYSALIHDILAGIDSGSDNCILGNIGSISQYDCITDNLDVNLTVHPQGDMLRVYAGSVISSTTNDYANLYKTIRNANIIIEDLKGDELNSDLGNKVVGVAYTLRAVCYYNLIRLYAESYDINSADSQLGVPLETTFDMEAKTLRSSLSVCVDRVVEDLQKAIEYNVTDKNYLFTIDVTKAYLAKIYFWSENWSQVINVALPLLEKYPLIGGSAYLGMINERHAVTGNTLIRSYTYPNMGGDMVYNTITQSITYRPVSKEFVDLFVEKENDIRYVNFFNDKRQTKKNIVARVRSAELALMLAESYAHINKPGDALDVLNDLRSKRIQDYTPLTLSNLLPVNILSLVTVDAMVNDLDPLMQAILNERQKELFMEGDRWFELKRNGCPEFWVAQDGYKYSTEKFMYTFPIPKRDLVIVPGLKQNPGYK
jgi:hypothetical protein